MLEQKLDTYVVTLFSLSVRPSDNGSTLETLPPYTNTPTNDSTEFFNPDDSAKFSKESEHVEVSPPIVSKHYYTPDPVSCL